MGGREMEEREKEIKGESKTDRKKVRERETDIEKEKGRENKMKN